NWVAIMDAAKERDTEDLSDDIKPLYVVITRARQNLVVTFQGTGSLRDQLVATWETCVKSI
ncbi:hypothetical protein, partial [Enterobacter hormaechei]